MIGFTLLYGGLAVIEVGLMLKYIKVGPADAVEPAHRRRQRAGSTLTCSY